ncbi:hypothetical protein BOTCAL_0469g00040 [Botryotinia calthae]|uniref:Uncharacterized protein n=1 Tax=Botryotinia calthae TaxID=38488 RepID=A0A4Y8CN46_9HELO|nr:hypothetical protein BOTCAL_0469g00040 [Botryotinia calthae]
MDGLPRIKDEPNDNSFSFSFKSPKLDRKSVPSNLSTLKNGMQAKLEQDLPTEPKDPVIFQGKHESSASDEKFSAESKVDLSLANKPTTFSKQSRPKRNIGTSGCNVPQTVFTHSDLQRMLVGSLGPVVVTEKLLPLGNHPQMKGPHSSPAMNNQQSGYLIIPIGQLSPSVQMGSNQNCPVGSSKEAQEEVNQQADIKKSSKRTLNAFIRLGACANYHDPTHQLKDCMICNDEGYMDGCPICNSLDHQFYQCQKIGQHKNTLWNFAKVYRKNKPPLRLLDDHRNIWKTAKKSGKEIKGKKQMACTPWTAEFARKNRNSWMDAKIVDMRSKRKLCRLEDPAWKDPRRVPLQISVKDMHLVKNLEQKLPKLKLHPSLTAETKTGGSPLQQSNAPRMAQGSRPNQTINHEYDHDHNDKTNKDTVRVTRREDSRDRRPLIQKPGNSYLVGAGQQARSGLPVHVNGSPSHATGSPLQGPRLQTYDEMVAEEYTEMMRRNNAWCQEERKQRG